MLFRLRARAMLASSGTGVTARLRHQICAGELAGCSAVVVAATRITSVPHFRRVTIYGLTQRSRGRAGMGLVVRARLRGAPLT